MARPKFIYNEHVEISRGFYTGVTGVIKEVEKPLFAQYRYSIKVNNPVDFSKCYVDESDIKSLDRPHKEFDEKLQRIIEYP